MFRLQAVIGHEVLGHASPAGIRSKMKATFGLLIMSDRVVVGYATDIRRDTMFWNDRGVFGRGLVQTKTEIEIGKSLSLVLVTQGYS
jgi:UDP-3-O-[3-hydroxymyristoyl] glucosamine N-acyltransferase